MNDQSRTHPFRDSVQDTAAADCCPETAQTRAPAYRLAFADPDFLLREDLRPVRLQLELLKPKLSALNTSLGVDSKPVGAWLASDAGDSVYQLNRGDAIAGKPDSHSGEAMYLIDRSGAHKSLNCSSSSCQS